MAPDDSAREPRPPRGRQKSVDLVLDALRSLGPTSQASIARATELSPATINAIVKELLADGVATVAPLNKRESVVSLTASTNAIVCVQVNVATIHVTLFSFADQRRLDEHLRVDVVAGEGQGTPDDAEELVRRVCKRAGVLVEDLAGVAIAMQGPISRETGTVISWAALQLPFWHGVPVGEEFRRRLGVPVIADNDANLAALAEWTWGSGRGSSDFVYVTCAAGIGSGIVIDGKVYRGGDGLAGEIGHLVLDQTGELCFCGSRGCLTTYASERFIVQALTGSSSSKTGLTQVIDAARRGDPACQRVLIEAGRALGRALANTAKMIAPSVIAVGGTLSLAGPLLFDSIRSAMELNSLHVGAGGIRLLSSRIHGDEILLGGLAAVLQQTGQGVSELAPWMTTREGRSRPDTSESE